MAAIGRHGRRIGGSAVPDEVGKIARDLAKRFPEASSHSLARRLVAESNGAITHEQARSRFRYLFGAHGKAHRKETTSTVKRRRRESGEKVEMPRSRARPWTPFQFPAVGRIGVLSDAHIPFHDDDALAAAVDHLASIGIAGLLLNGDWADFYSVSHWVKNPRDRDFRAELHAVRTSLSFLRLRFPKIPIVYKLGNHEERWQKWLWQHAVEISDEPEMGLDVWLRTARHEITIVEEQRIVMLGELPVLHGHELPRGISSPVNPARGAFMRTKHTVLVGHQHQTSGHCEADMNHRETFCWSTGCLCDMTPEYARINRWNHGFAVVDVQADGQFDVENLRIAGGRVRSS